MYQNGNDSRYAIGFNSGSSGVIRDCVIKNSIGEFSNCEIFNCGHAAIVSAEKAKVLINHCHIHDNESAGIKTRAAGIAVTEDSRFENNKLGDREEV